ncbi:MAG: ABC-type branched-chain amino acid transport system, substrate-binding protein [Actinomycetia bacterium]|nr:ABC-type branched-chain amino acid transport system, substrate-binding protein [Actinomycetes bacterium]
MRRSRSTAVLLLVLILAAACGQKAGVGGVQAGDAFGTTDQSAGQVSPGTGDAGAAGGTTDTVAGSTETTVAPGGTAAGTPTTAAAGGTAPSGTAAAAKPAGDRTGITDKVIKIGIHAPVSGAAPFPQTSFSKGAPVYWKFLDTKGGVFGRSVQVVFEDDEFNPATAKRVCQKMVEQDKVFLLIGGGGADQITACAQYANSVGVPYLSAGVNQTGLNALRGYFALSQTYSQQSPMLAQLAKKRLGGGKVAIAVEDTPSFADAHASIVKAMKDQGLQIVYDKPLPKDTQQTQALAIANGLKTSGAQIVYILAAPTAFLNIAAAATGQGYNPQYIGPGITSGLNLVASIGCPAIGAARFLSPFPQLDVIDRLDRDFRPAYQKFAGGDPDDIALALWGLSKGLNAMFQAAGKDMTRQSFVQTLEGGKRFATGVYPPVQFSPSNHFGGSQSHLLKADCQARQYKTEAQFVSGF